MASYLLSVSELVEAAGARAQGLRLSQNVTQAELARNAGVGLKALRRFEATGMGTMETVARLAIALGVSDGFDGLFAAPPFASLDEAEAHVASASRRRARSRK